MAELWESDCVIVELVHQEQRIKDDYLLAQQFACQKMVELLILLTGFFLTIATIVCIVAIEQSSSNLPNRFELNNQES